MINAPITDSDLARATAPGAHDAYTFVVYFEHRSRPGSYKVVRFAILNGRDRHAFTREYRTRILGPGWRTIATDRPEVTTDDDGADA